LHCIVAVFGDSATIVADIVTGNAGNGNYTVSQKKQATLIFDITWPSVEIFVQFLKHLVQD